MPIFNTLIKTLTRTSPRTTRAFFAATQNAATSSSSPFPIQPLLHSPQTRFTAALPKWIYPASGGPLFLTQSTPWKLSQTATPLYQQCDVVQRTKARALDLLETAWSLPQVEPEVGLVKEGAKKERVVDDDDDGVKEFVKSFMNVPNLISMSRLISGPALGWMIVNEMYAPAFLGLAISGATDWLDGYVARRMNINSVVGSYLDPLADKVLIGCVAVAMVHNDLLHPGLVALVVLRDVGLVGGAVHQRASSLGWKWNSWLEFFNLDGTQPQKVEPLFISKVNTVFQLLLVAAALLQPEFGTADTQPYNTYLSWLVASTTVGSTAAYVVQHMKKRALKGPGP